MFFQELVEEFVVENAEVFLSHVIKHVIDSQPVELYMVTSSEDMAVDILMYCKEMLRCERKLSAYRAGLDARFI